MRRKNPSKGDKHVRIRHTEIEFVAANAGSSELTLYLILIKWASNGFVFRKTEFLASKAAISKRGYFRLIKKLIDLGVVKVLSKGDDGTLYQLMDVHDLPKYLEWKQKLALSKPTKLTKKQKIENLTKAIPDVADPFDPPKAKKEGA